jgi:hypothetical protein
MIDDARLRQNNLQRLLPKQKTETRFLARVVNESRSVASSIAMTSAQLRSLWLRQATSRAVLGDYGRVAAVSCSWFHINVQDFRKQSPGHYLLLKKNLTGHISNSVHLNHPDVGLWTSVKDHLMKVVSDTTPP